MTFRPCRCGSYPVAHRHAGGRVTTEHECRLLAHERTWGSEAEAVAGWNGRWAARECPVLTHSAAPVPLEGKNRSPVASERRGRF